MFAVITSLIDLIAEIVGGAFRLVATFVSSCVGLVIVAMIVVAVVVFALFHML